MGMGSTILYKEAPATREVLGDAAESFQPDDPVAQLTKKIGELAGSPERCAELGRLAMERAERLFSWSEVTSRYERLFEEIGVRKP
jgi:glycosyltransferase involved in cell wall biosynthesis